MGWHTKTYSADSNRTRTYRVTLTGKEDMEAVARQFSTTVTEIIRENPQMTTLKAGQVLTVTGRYCGETPVGGARKYRET